MDAVGPDLLTRRAILAAGARLVGIVSLAPLVAWDSSAHTQEPFLPFAAPRPRGLAFLPDGTMVVTAAIERRGYAVLRYDAHGNLDRAFTATASADRALNMPTRVALYNEDTIAVSDTNNCRICLFSVDGKPGRVVGGPGFTPGLFHYPVGLAVHEGLLFVADTGNHCVQIVDRFGAVEKTIGRLGDAPDRFRRPRDLARLEDGRIVVLDEGHGELKVFDESGRFKKAFLLPGGGAVRAVALAVDRVRGRIAVGITGAQEVILLDLDGRRRGEAIRGVRADALAFHPDGRLAVCGVAHSHVLFYQGT